MKKKAKRHGFNYHCACQGIERKAELCTLNMYHCPKMNLSKRLHFAYNSQVASQRSKKKMCKAVDKAVVRVWRPQAEFVLDSRRLLIFTCLFHNFRRSLMWGVTVVLQRSEKNRSRQKEAKKKKRNDVKFYFHSKNIQNLDVLDKFKCSKFYQ